MEDSTKRYNNDLRFLLKDKYQLFELDIEKILQKNDYSSIPEKIKDDIQLLKSGYPVDYIIGYKDFLGLKINLNHKPLIPRPETEFWTEKIINTLNKESRLNILDIFCGSGCIGLVLLKNFPKASCTFADINPDYLSQTQQNAEINFIDEDRIELIQSDIFQNITGKFDLIVANPPYVSDSEPADESVKHEPVNAIFASRNGFELIDRFLHRAQNHLNNEGRFFMEFGETQKDLVEKCLENYHYDKWNFFKDQFGKWRWVEGY